MKGPYRTRIITTLTRRDIPSKPYNPRGPVTYHRAPFSGTVYRIPLPDEPRK